MEALILPLNVNKTKELIVDFRRNRVESDSFHTWEKECRGSRSINTSAFTWTGDRRGKPSTRRDRAGCTVCGILGPSRFDLQICCGECYLFSHHLLWQPRQSQGRRKAPQPDEEGWFCSGDNCGTSGDNDAKKDYSYSKIKIWATLSILFMILSYNRLSSVGGFFNFAITDSYGKSFLPTAIVIYNSSDRKSVV